MNLHPEETLAAEPVLENGSEIINGKPVLRQCSAPEGAITHPQGQEVTSPGETATAPVLEKGFEFIDGRAVEKPMGYKSSCVIAQLAGFLVAFVLGNKLGRISAAEGGFQAFPGDKRKIRKPDVSFVARGRFPNEKLPAGNCLIAPDLAAEVISPNDTAEEIEQRVADFLGIGTKLFWIVYPETHSVWIVRADGTGARLTESQSLSGEDIIPGFTLSLATLFDGI